MFAQRACVARFEEPTFCPSDASVLFPNSPLLERTIADTNALIDLQARRDQQEEQEQAAVDEDDDDEVGGVPLQPVHNDEVMADFTNYAHIAGPSVQTAPRTPVPNHGNPRQSQVSLPPSSAPIINTSTRNLQTYQHIPEIDEAQLDDDDDAIPVDDPLRNYDFADFMDLWRLRSIRDKRLPHCEPGLQPSVRLGRTVHEVARAHVNAGIVDMQGLRWELLGPARNHAAIAREILHPYRPGGKRYATPDGRAGERERHFRFRSFLPRHRAKFSHHQLRNLLAANSRNEVFYAAGNQVHQASFACPELREAAMDLTHPSNCAAGFRVTCLSASQREHCSENVLLAGSFYGKYALLPLDATSRAPIEGFVTHAYNGLITHIHTFADRRSGLLQAAFCANDRKVRLMDVRTLRFTSSFSYDHAINCSATSADGRLRVHVGDSQEVLVTDAAEGRALVTLREYNDHGFACDWSRDGRYVAAAAQDGKIVLWDARNWSKPVRVLHSVMSCARSLNFTDGGALVVAEDDDVVRVYEAGRFDECQNIRFFGSIAGVALLNGGAEMAIANADKTVGGLLTFETASHGRRIGAENTSERHLWPRDGDLRGSDLVSDILV